MNEQPEAVYTWHFQVDWMQPNLNWVKLLQSMRTVIQAFLFFQSTAAAAESKHQATVKRCSAAVVVPIFIDKCWLIVQDELIVYL